MSDATQSESRLARPGLSDASQTLVLQRPHPRSLPEIAYQAIVEAILDRRIRPGARLSIDGLGTALEMSTTPVREALTRAAAERLVLQGNNRGFTVAPLLTEEEYHQLFEVRRLLELHALQSAKPTQQDIDRLEEIVARMPLMEHGTVYRDFREFNQADRIFHGILVAMSRNEFLVHASADLHFHLHVGRLYAGAGVIDFSTALREHAEIVEAIRSEDRRAVLRAVTRHITHAERRLKTLLPTRLGRGMDTSSAQ